MEWLKAILEKAVITDGKLYVEATMKTINAEFPKHAVPKQDYNDKVKELTTANDTIKDLKKNNAAQKASRAGSAASGTAASGSAGSGSSSGTANRSTSSATRLGSDTSRNVTVPYMAMLMRSQGKNDTSISSALRRDGYSSAEIAQILQQMKR